MTHKVKNATVWSFITELIAKIIVPVTNMILARLLIPEDFGLVATINMVITFADVLADSGFGQYLIQHKFEENEIFDNYAQVSFWSNLSISSTIWLLIFAFRNNVASFIGCDGYAIPLIIACIAVPLTSFNVPNAILQKKLDYKSLFISRISLSLTSLIVSICLALIGFGYWSLIIGMLSSNVVKILVLMIRSKWHPRLCYSFSILKKMVSYSIWILLEAIMMWACTWLDILIVSRAFNSYYVGLYKTTQTTVTGVLSVVTASVNSIVFVTLSKLKDDPEVFKKAFYTFQKKLAIIVIPMGFGMFLCSRLVTQILLGSKWLEVSEFLGIWSLCTAYVATMGTFCREALRAKGLPKVSFFVQLLHFLFIMPIIFLTSRHGYRTMIYARSFSYLQSILLLHIFSFLFLKINPFKIVHNTIWPTVFSLVMFLIGFSIKNSFSLNFYYEFAVIAFCIIVYFSILIIDRDYFSEVKYMLLFLKAKLSRKGNKI